MKPSLNTLFILSAFAMTLAPASVFAKPGQGGSQGAFKDKAGNPGRGMAHRQANQERRYARAEQRFMKDGVLSDWEKAKLEKIRTQIAKPVGLAKKEAVQAGSPDASPEQENE